MGVQVEGLMKQNPRHQVTGPVGAEEPQGSMGTNTLTLGRASFAFGVSGKRGWKGKERKMERERNSSPRKQNKEAHLIGWRTQSQPQAQATTLFLVISNRRDEGSSPSLADLSQQQLLKP